MTGVAGGSPARTDTAGYVVRSDDWTNNINTISEEGGGATVPGVRGRRRPVPAFVGTARVPTSTSPPVDAGLAAAWMSVVNKMNRDRIGADETGMSAASTGGANSKYNLYETKDGKCMLVGRAIEHHFYEHFCRAASTAKTFSTERVGFASREVAIDWGPPELRQTLAAVFRTRTADEWMDLAAEYDFVLLAPQPG